MTEEKSGGENSRIRMTTAIMIRAFHGGIDGIAKIGTSHLRRIILPFRTASFKGEGTTIMEPDALNQLLDELNAEFGRQAQEWNAQFGRVWDKQLSSLGRAIAAASDSSSPTTRDALHERLNQLCPLYLSMDEDQRDAFRKTVGNRKHLLWGFRAHTLWAAQRIQSPADIEWLRVGLAAASIEDARIDFRDTLMNLGELYIAAARHGIEPMEYFREVARLSSTELTPWKAFPNTQHILSNFDGTAFFHADVKPQMRQ